MHQFDESRCPGTPQLGGASVDQSYHPGPLVRRHCDDERRGAIVTLVDGEVHLCLRWRNLTLTFRIDGRGQRGDLGDHLPNHPRQGPQSRDDLAGTDRGQQPGHRLVHQSAEPGGHPAGDVGKDAEVIEGEGPATQPAPDRRKSVVHDADVTVLLRFAR